MELKEASRFFTQAKKDNLVYQFSSGKSLRHTSKISRDLLSVVELDHCEVETFSVRDLSLLQIALQNLQEAFPLAYETIERNTVVLVKIRSEKPFVSSTTYLEILGCTFISDWAFQFLPPTFQLGNGDLYPIQENLYHESLHQQLMLQINQWEVFDRTQKPESYGQIFVPWHNKFWSFEHALHAYYVYKMIAPMRRHFAGEREKGAEGAEVLFQGAAHAAEQAEILRIGLESAIPGLGQPQVIFLRQYFGMDFQMALNRAPQEPVFREQS
jgi:hypothetical protein